MDLNVFFMNCGTKPARKRVGRGIGSGHGKTCGRGHKGAGSRSGTKLRAAFEGGQTPMFRRVAKRGQGGVGTAVSLVKLSEIGSRFGPNTLIDKSLLVSAGMATRRAVVKVVAGDLANLARFRFSGCSFSRNALSAVLSAGGSVE